MSIIKVAAGVAVGFLALGVASGGLVRAPDGTVDVPATVDQGATKGGELAGKVGDNVGNSIGHSIGSAVDSSDLAKVGVAGAAAAGVVKYGPKWKASTGTKIQPKPVTEPALTPTTQPPKRRTGWCTDVVTGMVQPCEKVSKPTPTTQPATPTATSAPMSTVPFTPPSWSPTPATWKPCVGPLGVVSC